MRIDVCHRQQLVRNVRETTCTVYTRPNAREPCRRRGGVRGTNVDNPTTRLLLLCH